MIFFFEAQKKKISKMEGILYAFQQAQDHKNRSRINGNTAV